MTVPEVPAVAVRNLSLRFGSTTVLRRLTLDVAHGEKLAIFGPNGAGKTTLLRVLSGALVPNSGELRIDGLDLARHGLEVRARLGVLSHQTYLFGELTALENLRLYGRLYGVEHIDERAAELLERVGLFGWRDRRVDSFSRGQQQRLAIARAVVHEPAVLLLDEPDTGLDIAALPVLESVLLSGRQERTLLVATHNLEQARRICRSAVVLVGGRLACQLSMSELDGERLLGIFRNPIVVPR